MATTGSTDVTQKEPAAPCALRKGDIQATSTASSSLHHAHLLLRLGALRLEEGKHNGI